MRAQLNRIVVAVGLLVALPAIALAERASPGAGRRLSVRAVHRLARLCGVRFVVRRASSAVIDGPVVFTPNHSSALDIPALLVALPDVRFVAAADLYRNRLLALALRALGSVPVDRRDPRAAAAQLGALARSGTPLCLVVFPEGGIPPAGERRRFKSGAFALAIDTGATVVPVAIAGTDRALPPRAALAVRPGTVTIDLLAPIATDGLTVRDRKALRDQANDAVHRALALS
jgi:1-acyl-sn-glycerol-3-phosphate acyltransferase